MNEVPQFNWYDDVEVDVEEFEPVEKERYKINYYFDLILSSCKYITIVSFVIFLIRFIFNQSGSIMGIKINTILFVSTTFFGSLIVIVMVMEMILFILKITGAVLIEKRMKIFYRWASAAIWFMINLYFCKKFLKKEGGIYFEYVRSFLLSGILTSISFTIISIVMQLFYESFVAKSLDAKMKEVDLKEKIIAVMKSYRYEISDSSPSVSANCGCEEIFCMKGNQDLNSEDRGSHIDLNMKNEVNVGGLYFKPPEIQTLYDAKTLSRDVFSKATSNGKELTFNDFQKMFPNTQIALQAFSYFDTNDDKSISDKEFRDTIISFYIDRINLEKGFEIAKGFVDIVSDIFTIVVCGFLCLAYLVIFGVSLKDLLALALSSALVLNFAVSGMAVDLYFNFMVLLSHPFDIGDDVIIDGEDFTVYKIGLNSTAFLAKNGGKVKFINSVLWKKSLINMTRAPEKVILINFKIDSDVSIDVFRELKVKIHNFLKSRSFDYYEAYSLESSCESANDLKTLDCSLVVKSKNYKTKARKFYLRTELSSFLRSALKELGIKEK